MYLKNYVQWNEENSGKMGEEIVEEEWEKEVQKLKEIHEFVIMIINDDVHSAGE